MIKLIYTTGQEIQNELNRLYPKEHENFVDDYSCFITEEMESDGIFAITAKKLKAHIDYIDREGLEADCEGMERDHYLEQLSIMFERVLEIMERHNIYAINLLDKTESVARFVNADVKDIANFNTRNWNYIEVKNHLTNLPEAEKRLITEHLKIDEGSYVYSDYTYDKCGKYFVDAALYDVNSMIEADEFANEEERNFYTELKVALEKITCEVIEY